jgi:protein kinase A
MIQRKPANRLGLNGPSEVKNHPWLRDFPWTDLWNRKIVAPFIPPKEDNFDQKNINEDWKDQEDEEFKTNLLSLRRNSIQAQFNGYYFDFQLAALSQNSAFINTN